MIIATEPLCCFTGCKKLVWQDADADGEQHEVGKFHHVSGASIDGSSSDGFSDCPAEEGHHFCFGNCVLERLKEVDVILLWKKCKLPGCSMQVASLEKTLLSETGSANKEPSRVELSEADIVEALLEWTRDRKQEKVKVDTEFYKKHPWDIIPPYTNTTYVIAKLNRKSKSRKRSNTTITGSYWKQQGREDSFKLLAADVVKKHRTYIVGKQKSNVRFTLIEYVLDENGETGDWAVCKVSRKACSEPTLKKVRGSKRTRATSGSGNDPEASVVDPGEASEAADPLDIILRELPDPPDITTLVDFPEIAL